MKTNDKDFVLDKFNRQAEQRQKVENKIQKNLIANLECFEATIAVIVCGRLPVVSGILNTR